MDGLNDEDYFPKPRTSDTFQTVHDHKEKINKSIHSEIQGSVDTNKESMPSRGYSYFQKVESNTSKPTHAGAQNIPETHHTSVDAENKPKNSEMPFQSKNFDFYTEKFSKDSGTFQHNNPHDKTGSKSNPSGPHSSAGMGDPDAEFNSQKYNFGLFKAKDFIKRKFFGESVQDMIQREEESLRRKKLETEEEIRKKRMETKLAIKKTKHDSYLRMAEREDATRKEAYNLAASYSTPEQIAEYERKCAKEQNEKGQNFRGEVMRKSCI